MRIFRNLADIKYSSPDQRTNTMADVFQPGRPLNKLGGILRVEHAMLTGFQLRLPFSKL